MVKNLPVNAGDVKRRGSIPKLGRCPGEGYGNPLQYSCLENPMDRGAWRAAVHRVVKSRTGLSTCARTLFPEPLSPRCAAAASRARACTVQCAYWLSRVQGFVTLWTVARQAPLSMGLLRQEYWSRLASPPPGGLLDPGIEPASLNVSCIGRRILYHYCHLATE